MSSFAKLLAFCVLVIFPSTNAVAQIYEDIGNGNDICDDVVKYLFLEQEIVDELEPLSIPDIKHGRLETKNGKLYGLSSVTRTGNCTYGISDQDKNGNDKSTVYASAEVGVHNVSFTMDYKVRLIFLSVDGSMTGEVGHGAAAGTGHLTEDGEVKLDNFKITHFDNLKVTKISAIIPQSSFVLKTIVNMIVKDKKSQIVKALEDGISDYLSTRMKDITLD